MKCSKCLNFLIHPRVVKSPVFKKMIVRCNEFWEYQPSVAKYKQNKSYSNKV